MTTEFKVPDATCGHCKQTIESAVTALDGVNSAVFDLETKGLRVEHGDSVGQGDLVSTIEAAGYTPESV